MALPTSVSSVAAFNSETSLLMESFVHSEVRVKKGVKKKTSTPEIVRYLTKNSKGYGLVKISSLSEETSYTKQDDSSRQLSQVSSSKDTPEK